MRVNTAASLFPQAVCEGHEIGNLRCNELLLLIHRLLPLLHLLPQLELDLSDPQSKLHYLCYRSRGESAGGSTPATSNNT
jgi:hypothetical protein